MKESDFKHFVERSLKIRERYRALESTIHDEPWSIEEDALAFLTDAALVGRHVMSQQNRWPKEATELELPHKLGECFWWLIILAERMDMSPIEVFEKFLLKTETHLKLN